MPAGLIETLFTLLALLFFVVIPLLARARARRDRQRAGASAGLPAQAAPAALRPQEPQTPEGHARPDQPPRDQEEHPPRLLPYEEELLGLPPQLAAMLRRARGEPLETYPPAGTAAMPVPLPEPPAAAAGQVPQPVTTLVSPTPPPAPAAPAVSAAPAAATKPQPAPPRLAGLPARLASLSELQRAVAWAEILGPPRGLQDPAAR